ncbi:hypothetical protein Salat_0858700 [Sesamum alatum]|uniref:Uncharacterized protein n=1 Tax=Sesamum alatum TaxID=300844 RepID=A0AAE2CQP3_9LAMI|nr:hypothetical protein Salat_0858700 [Sesamum alatum]
MGRMHPKFSMNLQGSNMFTGPNSTYDPTNVVDPSTAYDPMNIADPSTPYDPTNVAAPSTAYTLSNAYNLFVIYTNAPSFHPDLRPQYPVSLIPFEDLEYNIPTEMRHDILRRNRRCRGCGSGSHYYCLCKTLL